MTWNPFKKKPAAKKDEKTVGMKYVLSALVLGMFTPVAMVSACIPQDQYLNTSVLISAGGFWLMLLFLTLAVIFFFLRKKWGESRVVRGLYTSFVTLSLAALIVFLVALLFSQERMKIDETNVPQDGSQNQRLDC
jgi:glucan phosphoethanolaminetransferase (alkaline phosphatase superfamily)